MIWKRGSKYHGESGDFTITETGTNSEPFPYGLFYKGDLIGNFASKDEAKKAAETHGK